MGFQTDLAKDVLKRTPLVLNSLLIGISDEWAHANEGEGTWSPFDIVGHMIHGEEADWIPRSKVILMYGEDRPFEPFDRTAMFEASKGKNLGELLDRFRLLREENSAELDQLHLTPELLQKRGMHPELGVVTLEQLLSTWVVHDLGHIAQISRVLAKQYAEAVGPWQAYLPVLER